MRIAALVFGRALASTAVLALLGGAAALTHPIALAFLALEAIWSVVEGTLVRGELQQTRAERMNLVQAPMSDAARRFLFAGKRYAIANLLYHAIVLGEFARRAAATPRVVGTLTIVGLGIYSSGALVRAWAMASMGERFKSWTVTRERRGLESAGAYAIVRHPSYLGLLLIAGAVPFIFGQPWLLLLALLPAGTIAARVELEERLLREVYSDEYPAYAARVGSRLLPGVW